ncbi:MAG: L-aspartate oxidase [Hyphomicrobiaceae bacterium]|nr:L-aspartate oxidase [Hyphomicrobiaceae bacterium]
MSTTPRFTFSSRSFNAAKGALGPGDIVIVGAGLAGLFTALKLAPLPVTVVAAAPLGEGASSVWAQGGVAAAVGEGDTPEAHAADTIAAGAGLVDAAVAQTIAAEAPERIRDLLAYGVPFDKDLAGHFVLSREAAHSAKRVVRVAGDRAGAAIMAALIATVRQTPSIRVLEGFEAEDLIVEDGRVVGVQLVRDRALGNGSYAFMPAAAVVLATGGIGGLYRVTTNPAYARGQALAMAARAGAVIADAEFVQFHPTALDVGKDPAPLATEALRGEGAVLVNGKGERFMLAHHPDAELAPRDVVARGVFTEIAAGRGAFLDCRSALGAEFAVRYPTVYQHCIEAGIDPACELIPVAPAAHYHMGGIATDLDGRSSVPGLWAVGEVASTGLHGANRLASNSLLEAVVVGDRVASDIRRLADSRVVSDSLEPRRLSEGSQSAGHAARPALIARLRQTMANGVGVVRDAAGLVRAVTELGAIAQASRADLMVHNMAVAASFVAVAALLRAENRGAHSRRDGLPAQAVGRRSFFTLADVEAVTAACAGDETSSRSRNVPVPVAEAVRP